MKGLLQSKRFKKNLGKWVFMYVICMGIFTTVITYSKYISNMLDDDDSARVSKFNVGLKYCKDVLCKEEGIEPFDPERYRPYEKMIYYFALDKSTLEVQADLLLTLKTDRHFKIKEVYLAANTDIVVPNESQVNNGKVFTIRNTIKPGETGLAIYKVVIEYDETVVDKNESGKIINGIIKDDSGYPKYIFNENTEFTVLTVDYTVEQSNVKNK